MVSLQSFLMTGLPDLSMLNVCTRNLIDPIHVTLLYVYMAHVSCMRKQLQIRDRYMYTCMFSDADTPTPTHHTN